MRSSIAGQGIRALRQVRGAFAYPIEYQSIAPKLSCRRSGHSTFAQPQIRSSVLRAQFRRPHAAPFRLIRLASTDVQGPPVKRSSRAFRALYRTFAWLGIFIVVSGGLVVAFFIYDYTTYVDDPEDAEIPISEFALNPRIGGPKKLPIAEHLVDDDESPVKKSMKHKPKLVVLGTGWGSIAMLKSLNLDEYHVTVVSPSNYFLFTPMLPSATVGTLELRSLVEPVRRIMRRIGGHFIKAEAVDVDFSEKLVECKTLDEYGAQTSFYLPYDKLVIGVGSVTNPHSTLR